MPLSEQEQRMLDEMERQLMGNDADVVSAPAPGRALSYRNLTWGAVLVVAGIIGLIGGVSVSGGWGIAIGALSFLVMVVGVVFASTPVKGAAAASDPTSPRSAAEESSLMDRLNERWDRREQ